VDAEALAPGIAAGDEKHLAQSGLTLEGRVHRVPRPPVRDHGHRARVLRDVVDFVGREHRRRGDGDRTALHRAEERRRVLEAIRQADQHAIAGRDAERLQGGREAARPLGEPPRT